MLDENDIISAVCDHLEKSEGYIIKQRLSTTEQGIDIIVEHPDRPGLLLIEAKGGTSSFAGSNRYGKEYTQTQVFDRVSKGFFTVAKMKAESAVQDRVALACPDTVNFRKYLNQVKPVLVKLEIEVFLVQPDRSVVLL